MWETIGWGVLGCLAGFGAFTLLEGLYRTVAKQEQATSFILKLSEIPASKQEVSEMIDALLAERIAEKEIEITPAMRRGIRRDVLDELVRADMVR